MRTLMITPEGFEKLKEELDWLWKEERPEITRKVSWAASLGDRSENADYHYNKRRLKEIDRRIHYIRKRIDDLQVIQYHPHQEGKVMFGAWIDVENNRGLRKKLRIVGYEELLGNKDYISIDSPLAQALLKKQEGDEVEVNTPAGLLTWKIHKIEYEK